MRKNRKSGSTNGDDSPIPDTPPEQTIPEPRESTETAEPPLSPPPAWPEFLQTATDNEVRERFSWELTTIVGDPGSSLSGYSLLALLEPEDSIGPFELDQIYRALSANDSRDRNVLLILLSRGGIIEPAYQISKLCKAYSKERYGIPEALRCSRVIFVWLYRYSGA